MDYLYFCSIRGPQGDTLMAGHWLAPNAEAARLLLRRRYLARREEDKEAGKKTYPIIELCEERATRSKACAEDYAMNFPGRT